MSQVREDNIMSSYVKFREVRGEVDSARLRGLGEDHEDELLFNAERIGLKITAGHIEPRMAQIVPQPDVKAVSDFLVCLAAISPHPEQVRICYFAESGSMECWQWGSATRPATLLHLHC